MNGLKANWAILAGAAGLVLWSTALQAQVQQTAGLARPAAVVNGEAISRAEIDQVTALIIKDQFKLQPATEEQRRDIRAQVVMMAIDDALMRQFLARTGIQVAPAEVEKHMAELAENLKKGTPSRTVADFCRETGQSEAQVRDSVANMLRWAEYVKTKITEADVRKYFDENREVFDMVQVRASHVMVRLAPNASEAERQAAAQKLAGLRTEILAGKLDFAEAAKKHSTCPTASGGGDLGFFPRRGMPEPFAKAAFALQVGGVSDIVATDLGLHLIKVTERKNGTPADYQQIREEVHREYVEEVRQNILMQERMTAKIDVDQ